MSPSDLQKELSELKKTVNSCATEYDGIVAQNESDDLPDIIARADAFKVRYVYEFKQKIRETINKYPEVVIDKPLFNETLGYGDTASDYYDRINLHVAKLVSDSNKKVLRRTREGLVNQLSVFSIVLAILSFMLNNAKLLSFESLSFYMLMAGNISFILMCLVMFALIYYFLHVDEGIKDIKGKASIFIITVILLGLIIIGLVSCSPHTQITPTEQPTASPQPTVIVTPSLPPTSNTPATSAP